MLARVIEHLKKKDKPFCVIDAHAGIGVYDLTGNYQNYRDELPKLPNYREITAEIIVTAYQLQ